MQFAIWLAQLCAWIAIAAVLVFIIAYNWAAKWSSTPEGRNVMLLSVIILIFALIGQLSRYGVIPPYTLPYVVSTLWVGVTVAYLRRTVLMLRAQGFWRDSERRDRFDKGSPDQG